MLGMLQTMVQPEAVIHALGPKYWIDPRYIPGENGALITTASDRSGNGYNFTQGTVSKKPSLKLDLASIPAAMSFDGVDDSMSTPSTIALSRKITFACMHYFNSSSFGMLCEISPNHNNYTNGNLFGRNDSSTAEGNLTFGGRSNTNYNVKWVSSSYNIWVPAVAFYDRVATDTSDWNNTTQIWITGTQAPNAITQLDGAANGTFGTYNHYMGSRNNASSYFKGYISTFCLFDKKLTSSEIISLDSALRDIHGRIV